MNKNLITQAAVKYFLGILLLGGIIFIPAGSLHFFNGWLLMGILFIPMLIVGVVMAVYNPELLKKRLSSKEKQKDQKSVVKLSGLMFVLGFITAGLGYRFEWYQLPNWVVTASSVIFILSYIMYLEVMRENTYLSRTVEIQENQKVIDTGLYSIVRHPMYTATIFLFLSMPLILGSLYSFLIFFAYPFIITKRIKGEEQLLESELAGYAEYKRRVRYRLFPCIW